MSANRIYLVCSHHANPEDALLLCERAGNTPYEIAELKRADKWFAKHQACGRTRDHFQIAHNRPMNWDVPAPAENTIAGGVKLAIATEGLQ